MITKVQVDTRCGHLYPNKTRCKNEGNPCWLPGWIGEDDSPDNPHDYLCNKHMFLHGYCPGCGLFWGGVESFEFSNHHLCDNCEDDLRSEMEEEEETYSNYPFDAEEDWHEEE